MKVLSHEPGDGEADETRLGADETRLAAGPSADDDTRLASGSSGAGGTRRSSSAATGGSLTTPAIDHGRFTPGTLLGGRYRIVGKLGKGGMGEVFRADDLKLGQQVALKFLPPDVDRDPVRLTQLHTEVRMARQVSHPNVCRVYDIDEVDGHTFLSMEYVDGEDLASLLRRIGRFNQERGLEIARQVCAGLAAAHERGVIHRDFKPANVMVDGAGHVRITDFGLAGASGETIRAGTPAYMAPEQLAGGEVTARSDIYALGLVLYEIFTGRRALEADNLAELIRRREQAEIAPPSTIARDLSPEIDRAIMRCLAPDPASRPASALAVSAALPGGDPLAAALAAGETPSPEMVAAAGEATDGLTPRSGALLLGFFVLSLIGSLALGARTMLVNRVSFERSVDVLEDRARTIIRTAGYTGIPADTARGAALNGDYVAWLTRNFEAARWTELLSNGEGPLLRFWYRTSPRELNPTSVSWARSLNNPPFDVSGMTSIVVDDQGRLLEFVAMPPQLDTSEQPATPANWARMFEAAQLPIAEFRRVTPQWTPRMFADDRMAWEGPMRGFPGQAVRVEAASYRGQPVSFQVVWPWTRPTRMETPPVSTLSRVLSVAVALVLAALIAGAILLSRHNLRSGRADRRGATRVALFLAGVWVASWGLSADHSLSIDTELSRFIGVFSFAWLNVGITWLFYLALEPFVRRLYPEILITWTRVLAGRLRDARVGRDVLVGVAAGTFLYLASAAAMLSPQLVGQAPLQPAISQVNYLFGNRYTIGAMLLTFPNALQVAMIGTFLFVLLLALVRRRSVAAAIVGVPFGGLIVFATSQAGLLVGILFAVASVGTVIFVFLRYGLVGIAVTLMTTQALNIVPITADLTKPHALGSATVLITVVAVAVYAFRISGAGNGMFRRLVPAG
jgi:tRNA A-37 threonylcarbamoyl transferase component Bud32